MEKRLPPGQARRMPVDLTLPQAGLAEAAETVRGLSGAKRSFSPEHGC